MQVEVLLSQGILLFPTQLGLCMEFVNENQSKWGVQAWPACFFDTFPVTVHY